MTTRVELLGELIDLSHFLGDPQRNLAILGEGNTSARLDLDTFLVKASGQNLGSIAATGFCAVNFSIILPCYELPTPTDEVVKAILLDCRTDQELIVMPSVETFFHAYFLTLPNVNFVGHTHPISVNSILCSKNAREATSGRLFPDEVVCCGVAPCFVEYTDPGIVLAKLIKKRVEEHIDTYGETPKVVLMQNHGLIALGRSAKDVMAITLMYEKVCRVLLGAYTLGGPNFMSDEDVSRIHTRPDEHYRQQALGQR